MSELNGSILTLSWDQSTDNAPTPQAGLTYNIRVGTTPGGSEISSPMANTSTGLRTIPALGNTNHNNSWKIEDLDLSKPYYWSVQAIDHTFAGSPFATENMYVPPFTEVTAASLPGVEKSSGSWGDYDNDGDLDLILTGDTGAGFISKIYKNEGNDTFAEVIVSSLLGVTGGCVSWGDYDNDGDLDLVLTGDIDGSGTGDRSKLYKNEGNDVFSEVTSVSLVNASFGSCSWGDYDNDGDLDLIITGYGGINSGYVSKLYKNEGNDTFTEVIPAALDPLNLSTSSWGDYDNDGDLDLILTGYAGNGKTSLYKNNNSVLVKATTVSLAGVYQGSSSWGDYDNDGDLDLLLTGLNYNDISDSDEEITKLYKNEGNDTFTEIVSASFEDVASSSSSWGDFDNDGDLDLVITGTAGGGNISKLYKNEGSDTFTEVTAASLPGVNTGSSSWGDYDNDGDLDLLLTGNTVSGGIAKIYKNNSDTPNTPPDAPENLMAELVGSSLTLSWDQSTDNAPTPQEGLTYNIRVGTTPGGSEISSPMANTTSGLRTIPALGSTNHNNSWKIEDLDFSLPVFWSVQAIDHSFAGSPFATEAEFSFPKAELGPLGIVRTGAPNQIITANLKISNLGSIILDFNIEEDLFSSTNISVSDIAWLSVSPDNGSVGGSSFTDIDVTLDATGLAPGQYSAQLHINSNDPLNPTISIPVLFCVIDMPEYTWINQITVMDASGPVDLFNLKFGQAPTATDGIDPLLNESNLPPLPPDGILEGRLILPDPVNASFNDFRNDSEESMSWLVKFQPGPGGYPMLFNWDPDAFPLNGKVTLKDPLGGAIVYEDMRLTDGYVLDDPAITSLIIDIRVETCTEITVNEGWNMLSVPFLHETMMKDDVFPNSTSQAFWYNGGYVAEDPLVNSHGYWLKFPADEIIQICGIPADGPVDLIAGWNMIGVYGENVPVGSITTVPDGIVTSPFYGFDNGYYAENTALQIGEAYWIKTSAVGVMNFNSSLPKGSSSIIVDNNIDKDWGRLIITDIRNRKMVLYVGDDENSNSFELPPSAPEGIFDVRYSNDKSIMGFGKINDLLVNGAEYPIRVRTEGMDLKISDKQGGSIVNSVLRDGNQIVVEDRSVNIFEVAQVEIPVSFELYQNYPNPFNPSTKIKFGLPENTRVKLEIYNTLGERVEVLRNEEMEAGYHEIDFNASRLSSGVYFYSIQTGSFSEVKKMMLLK